MSLVLPAHCHGYLSCLMALKNLLSSLDRFTHLKGPSINSLLKKNTSNSNPWRFCLWKGNGDLPIQQGSKLPCSFLFWLAPKTSCDHCGCTQKCANHSRSLCCKGQGVPQCCAWRVPLWAGGALTCCSSGLGHLRANPRASSPSLVGLPPPGNGAAWSLLQGSSGTMRWVAWAAFPTPRGVGALLEKQAREFSLKSFEINIPVNHQMLKNKQVVPGWSN